MSAPIVLLSPAAGGVWSFVWIDASGVERDLSSTQYMVARGTSGMWMPPVRHVEDELPFLAGSRLRRVKTEARTFDLPVTIQAASQAALSSQLRALLRWFDPSQGDGIFRVTSPDASVRQITARYAGGLDLSDGASERGIAWQRAVLSLRAVDPYWSDTSDTTVTYALDDGSVNFFPWDGFFSLNASSLFATSSVTNDGDVEAWPVWTIEGPATDPVLWNLTTGDVLELDRTLVAGETLTIDTRPNLKSITDQSGNNLFSAASATSSFWSLSRGNNAIRVECTGADNVTSQVTLSFRQRYLGP